MAEHLLPTCLGGLRERVAPSLPERCGLDCLRIPHGPRPGHRLTQGHQPQDCTAHQLHPSQGKRACNRETFSGIRQRLVWSGGRPSPLLRLVIFLFSFLWRGFVWGVCFSVSPAALGCRSVGCCFCHFKDRLFRGISVPVPVPVFVPPSPARPRFQPGPVELFRCLRCSLWIFQSPGRLFQCEFAATSARILSSIPFGRVWSESSVAVVVASRFPLASQPPWCAMVVGLAARLMECHNERWQQATLRD